MFALWLFALKINVYLSVKVNLFIYSVHLFISKYFRVRTDARSMFICSYFSMFVLAFRHNLNLLFFPRIFNLF